MRTVRSTAWPAYSSAAPRRNISAARCGRAWATSPTPSTPCSASDFPVRSLLFSGAGLQRQRLANRRRPAREVEPVCCEQRERQPIDAEGDATGMRHVAGGGAQVPGQAEMVAMIVEAHARRRLLRRADRHQQLELELLLDLTCRHELAAA